MTSQLAWDVGVAVGVGVFSTVGVDACGKSVDCLGSVEFVVTGGSSLRRFHGILCFNCSRSGFTSGFSGFEAWFSTISLAKPIIEAVELEDGCTRNFG